MEEEKSVFRVVMEIANRKFKEDLNKTEEQLKELEKPHRMPILTDTQRVPKEFQKVFDRYNALAAKMSKISLFDRMMGDERKGNVYGRFFNDIRSDAVNAIEQMNNELPEIKLRMHARKQDMGITKQAIADIEHQLKNAEKRANKWQIKMDAAVNFNPQDIQKQLDDATANLRKAELDNMALPDWKTDEKAAKQEEIANYKAQIDALTEQLNNPPDMSKYEKNFARAAKQIEFCKQQLKELNALLGVQTAEQTSDKSRMKAIGKEYEAVVNDIKQNPLDVKLESKTLKRYSKRALEIKETFRGVNKEINKMNAKSKMTHKIFTRMTSQIAYWLNPLNIFIRTWEKWQEQNKAVKNTFEVISYNLVKVIAPLMETFANFLLKAAQYANIFTKAWFGVDLFDKTAKSAEETKETVDSMTASFDELHSVDDDKKDDDTTLMDLGQLPAINKELEAKLGSWANGTGKWVGDVLNWAMEHPILAGAAFLGGKWVLSFLGGKALGAIGKGIKGLFTGKVAADAAATGGSAAGAFWASSFGTAVKVVGGAALTVAGTALAAKSSHDLTKFWHTSTTGQKVLSGVGTAAGIATAGIGGYITAAAIAGSAAGPVGAAIAAVGATLIAVGVSAFTARDSIMSVKDATEQYNSALELQAQCQLDYTNAVANAGNALATLEALEAQTGLSGKALAEQVDAGTLSVENMTSAQLQVYGAYLQNEQAVAALKVAHENLTKANENEMRSNIELMMSNADESKSYDEVKAHILQLWKEGKISTSDAQTYISRCMGNMSDDARQTFAEDIPGEIKEGLDPNKYEPWGRSLGRWIGDLFSGMWKSAQETWQRVCNLFKGNGFKTDAQVNADGTVDIGVNSYDVGTNYVPNDQLAMIHKGEAIIPAKYNKPYTPVDNGMSSVVSAMTTEIANLRALINEGIPVSGQFVQKGQDLYATVEKAKSRRGTQPISNAAYAR